MKKFLFLVFFSIYSSLRSMELEEYKNGISDLEKPSSFIIQRFKIPSNALRKVKSFDLVFSNKEQKNPPPAVKPVLKEMHQSPTTKKRELQLQKLEDDSQKQSPRSEKARSIEIKEFNNKDALKVIVGFKKIQEHENFRGESPPVVVRRRNDEVNKN